MLKAISPRRKLKQIGPDDDGRHMSLAEFDIADGKAGFLYELNKGVIEVTNIPHRRHFMQQTAIRNQTHYVRR